MFYPYGFGFGSHWLLYIGVPLIIALWAQFRVSSAFRKWGEVRASSNITGAECAREILDRKSTRLNSSHPSISYAVFCLKKKKQKKKTSIHKKKKKKKKKIEKT